MCGMLGVQGVLAERLNSVHVAHFLQILVIPDGDLLDLVGGTEAVEEVDEGNAALDGGQVRHSAQVHDLLRVGLSTAWQSRSDGRRMTSEWSPKMFSAWVATARADTWKTLGSSSPAILYMLGIISSRP